MVTYVALGGTGTVDFDDTLTGRPITYPLALSILNPALEQAPTVLLAAMDGGIPDVEVRFYVDGALSYTTLANSQGAVAQVSISISRTQGTAGSHSLQVRQTGAISATQTFTVAKAPSVEPTSVGSDTNAVEVPGAVTSSGIRRWVWQDLMPGGIGSWIMPMNPEEMTAPYLQVNTTSMHTTALGGIVGDPTSTGRFHIFEGTTVPSDWTFKGYCPFKEMHDKMLQYRDLNRRLYIIDHRNRAWKVVIMDVSFTPKLRQNYNGVPTDWGADYEVTCLVLDQSPVMPA